MNFFKNLFGNNALLPLGYVCSVRCTCKCGDNLDQVVDNSPNNNPGSHTVSGTKKP